MGLKCPYMASTTQPLKAPPQLLGLPAEISARKVKQPKTNLKVFFMYFSGKPPRPNLSPPKKVRLAFENRPAFRPQPNVPRGGWPNATVLVAYLHR